MPPEISRDDLYATVLEPRQSRGPTGGHPRPARRRTSRHRRPDPDVRGLAVRLVTGEFVDAAAVMRDGPTDQDARRAHVPRRRLRAGRSRAQRAGRRAGSGRHRTPTARRLRRAHREPRRAHRRRRKASASPRPQPARCTSAICHPIARSATASWWCWRPARCTPATRPAWPAPGWPGARTRRRGGLATRCARSMDALLAACRPGSTGADLYRAWEGAGNRTSDGAAGPRPRTRRRAAVIGLGRGRDATLEEGMVLSVQSWVVEDGVGGCLERATVQIGSAGSSALTRYGRL